jgi:hypothetical protein
MDKQYFIRFQELCIDILSQSDNCQESQNMFREAKSVPELVAAWQRFWAGVLHEVPEQVITAFSKLYPVYRSDIIRAGVYYNESPITNSGGMVLVGDKPEGVAINPVVITGRHRVYVLGDMPVTVDDNCSVHVAADRADVIVKGHARAVIEQGKLTARDFAFVSGKGNITCYDAATLYVNGGRLDDHGHMEIVASGDAMVYSFTNRRITVQANAKLYYKQQ